MHAYLTRLGVRPEVQEFFAPFFSSDAAGNMVFAYGAERETYGFAFHRVPAADLLWIAGQQNYNIVTRIFICASAMEAISFLHYRFPAFSELDGLLFLAVGSRINPAKFEWLNASLSEKKYTLVFGGDFLGKVMDLKAAAGIRRVPVAVYESEGVCTVSFRNKNYPIPAADFTLSKVEKLSGYRFGIRTLKPKRFDTFFDQLKAAAF